MDGLIDFLQWALPSGCFASVVTWFVSRRKQDNDMLSQLQSSINMLSTENRKILDENIILRKENAELKVNQEETNMRIAQLVKEVERLRKLLTRRQAKDEKQNKMVDATTTDSGGRAANRLRHTKTDTSESIHSGGDSVNIGLIESRAGLPKKDDTAVSISVQGNTDGGAGDDTALGGEDGSSDSESPEPPSRCRVSRRTRASLNND